VTPPPTAAEDLALALRMADAADAITLARFGARDLRVDTKPDATPVTDADTAVEAALRRVLGSERPGDGVLGEEQGETRGAAGAREGGRRWVVDPVDGTANFLRGVPVWATLIALEVDGIPVVGVASAPALPGRWWASAGGGAYAGDGRRLAVSGVASLADASLSYSSLSDWGDRLGPLVTLASRMWRTRAYGDFYSHVLVAAGAVDVAAEPEVSRWDVSALDVIVREAGGRLTALDGTAGPGGGSVVTTNGLLHEEILASLAPPVAD